MNRRIFITTLCALPLGARAFTASHKSENLIWIGSCGANKINNGIYCSYFDPVTGILTSPLLAATTLKPSYFAISKTFQGHRHLYSVNEISQGGGSITSYRVDDVAGTLKKLNQVSSLGDGPCCISVNDAARMVFAANYHGGSISAFRILPDGSLSDAIEHLDFKDTTRFGTPGPDPRQVTPHPHSVTLSPDRRFLLVNDLGNDDICVLSIDIEKARLRTESPFLCKTKSAAGPRHISFHSNGRWVYGINEIDSTINQYTWDVRRLHAALRVGGPTVSTLAPGTSNGQNANAAAEIGVSHDGHFLYASNRGDDSLTVFVIDQNNGDLNFKQRISSGGKSPRNFVMDPSERWVLCCNNGSNSVTVFRRNVLTGVLSGPVQTVELDCPMFAMFS